MRLLAKKFRNSRFFITLKNSINLKPEFFHKFISDEPLTVSDAFLWRTDNNLKTKFEFLDILRVFYKIENSWVEIHIFSKDNKLLKIEKIENLNIKNFFDIDKKYLDGLEDYGLFYIYHFTKEKLDSGSLVVNRCYLGYSLNDNQYTYIHGNTYAKFTNTYPGNKIKTNIMATSLFENQEYALQQYFDNFDKTELGFSNPTSKRIKFTIEKKKYILESGCVKLVKVKDPIINIKSNCLLLRPMIFTYRDKYLDVHHS